jgi:hypothetical protein
MTQAIERADTYEQALVKGDLSGLSTEERISYYMRTCASLGLNPLTKPFEYIVLNNKLTLYARKDCTDQLRKLHKVNITDIEPRAVGDLFVVTVKAHTPDGRRDVATGAVGTKGLFGDNLANAMMRAETKAKRRVTLSLCGLGMLDESEVDSIASASFPALEESYTPTREREVDDNAEIVREDNRIWKRYLEVCADADRLRIGYEKLELNEELTIARLKVEGLKLFEAVEERKKLLDAEHAALITQQAEENRRRRDAELDAFEAERQRRSEGLR